MPAGGAFSPEATTNRRTIVTLAALSLRVASAKWAIAMFECVILHHGNWAFQGTVR